MSCDGEKCCIFKFDEDETVKVGYQEFIKDDIDDPIVPSNQLVKVEWPEIPILPPKRMRAALIKEDFDKEIKLATIERVGCK